MSSSPIGYGKAIWYNWFSRKVSTIFRCCIGGSVCILLEPCTSTMKVKEIGDTTYNLFSKIFTIITKALNKAIILIFSFSILSTFAKLTYSGQVFAILSVLWKVFIVVLIYICVILLYYSYFRGRGQYLKKFDENT